MIFHEHTPTSSQGLGSFARFIKSKILNNAYTKDTGDLYKSDSAEVFRRLYFPVGTYLKARPQAFRFDSGPREPDKRNECDRRYEGRKSRTGFYQALLGKHPINFMNLAKCPHCGTSHDSSFLDHSLFECDLTRPKRVEWLSNLETDILSSDLPDNTMNTKIFNIFKESILPLTGRHHQTSTIKLLAFGGHDVQSVNGRSLVTRRKLRRLGVSDILSFHTAALLLCTTNLLKHHRVLPES